MMAIDKIQVARQFSRAASRYHQVSEVQNKMVDHLLRLVPPESCAAKRIIDLGCGAGYLIQELASQYPNSDLYGLDIAAGMIEMSKNSLVQPSIAKSFAPKLIQADMESLPLASGSFDLLFSSAALQWTDSSKSLAEIYRILAPEGVAVLATFVEGTLAEWRSALDYAGMNGLHQLPTSRRLLEIAQSETFELVHSEQNHYRIEHQDVQSLLESTKQMGATNAQAARPKGLMGRGAYLNLVSALEAEFPDRNYQSSYMASFMVLRKRSESP